CVLSQVMGPPTGPCLFKGKASASDLVEAVFFFTMLILDQQAVTDLLPMRECIDLMVSTLSALARGDTILPLRTVVLIPNTNDAFAVMPAYIGSPKTMGAKIITVYPGNHGTKFD